MSENYRVLFSGNTFMKDELARKLM